MILYHCPTCGAWQDVSIAQAIMNAFAPFAEMAAKLNNQPYAPQETYPCPAVHGLMVQIQPYERIMLRPLEKPEQEAASYEQGYRA